MEMGRSWTLRSFVEHPQQWALACCALALLALLGNETWLIGHSLFYSPAAVAATANPERSRDLVERIVAAELFGRAAAQASNQPPPATSLQLTLRGVFSAQDPRSASAMIEAGDGHAQIVKIGANVAPDTVLQQVFSNHVVLIRNGVLESLYFPTPQEGASDLALAQNVATPSADMSTTNTDAGNNPAASPSPEELKRAAILRRLEELRSRSSH